MSKTGFSCGSISKTDLFPYSLTSSLKRPWNHPCSMVLHLKIFWTCHLISLSIFIDLLIYPSNVQCTRSTVLHLKIFWTCHFINLSIFIDLFCFVYFGWISCRMSPADIMAPAFSIGLKGTSWQNSKIENTPVTGHSRFNLFFLLTYMCQYSLHDCHAGERTHDFVKIIQTILQ